MTEKKEKDIVTSSDSQTVKATDMTNLKELVNELHKNKITLLSFTESTLLMKTQR